MEHIYEFVALGEEPATVHVTGGSFERRERIVRCRDCGSAYRRGGGIYCSRVLQWGSNDRPVPLPVNPDGFCAWGLGRAKRGKDDRA